MNYLTNVDFSKMFKNKLFTTFFLNFDFYFVYRIYFFNKFYFNIFSYLIQLYNLQYIIINPLKFNIKYPILLFNKSPGTFYIFFCSKILNNLYLFSSKLATFSITNNINLNKIFQPYFCSIYKNNLFINTKFYSLFFSYYFSKKIKFIELFIIAKLRMLFFYWYFILRSIKINHIFLFTMLGHLFL